jgi:hypothetical protein
VTALIRKTYVISCDHGLIAGERCGMTWQIAVPDESLGAASEYVGRKLTGNGWRRVGKQHFCRKHRLTATGKIRKRGE